MTKERGLVVDLFAGGGGASIGIEAALGRAVDVAINHDAEAIRMHEVNHPESKHYHCDIWEVDPLEATEGKHVDLLWASPDCTFFSKARGAKPFRDRKFANRRRALATVVCSWAKLTMPDVIAMENVEEFKDWGPLDKEGRPCKKRKGKSFKRWVRQLENLGYTVEWRQLKACDYGAPTTRKRLFIVATLNGKPKWPEATHGEGLDPYSTAADIIDWDIECPSIFERKKPLAEATLKRIARGVMRYVVEDDDPYIVDGKGATLIQTGYGERPGQTPRVPGLHKPLGTIMAGGCKHALVTAHITKYYGTSTGSAADEPLHTVTGKAGGGHHGLCVSYLARHWGGMTGTRVDKPFPTITTKGCQDQVVEAHLQPAKEFSHTGEVRSFLMKYYGTATGQEVTKPAPTITTKDRLALVTVAGVDYEIVDIGMRMLTPRELYNAQGFPSDYQIDMTMPKSVGAMESKPKRMTKTTQIRLCGNSVSPPVAHAIIRENLPNILDEE